MGMESPPMDPKDPSPDDLQDDRSTGEEPSPWGKARKHPEKQEPIKP